jgi:hypothetical protein
MGPDAAEASLDERRRLFLPLQPDREDTAGFRMIRLILRNITDSLGIGAEILRRRFPDHPSANPPALHPGTPGPVADVAAQGHAGDIPETSHR